MTWRPSALAAAEALESIGLYRQAMTLRLWTEREDTISLSLALQLADHDLDTVGDVVRAVACGRLGVVRRARELVHEALRALGAQTWAEWTRSEEGRS